MGGTAPKGIDKTRGQHSGLVRIGRGDAASRQVLPTPWVVQQREKLEVSCPRGAAPRGTRKQFPAPARKVANKYVLTEG